jgi:hypothetical protein
MLNNTVITSLIVSIKKSDGEITNKKDVINCVV